MELRQWLGTLRRWWWLAAISFVAVVGLTVVLTEEEPPAYRSSNSMLVQPRLTSGDESLRATDYLIRTDQVVPTLAEIATGREVRERTAAAYLSADPTVADQLDDIELRSSVLAGTTLVTMEAIGPAPDVTREFLRLVGLETIDYLASLDHLFTLTPLEEPSLPDDPLPSRRPMLIAGGAVLGALLAALAVFLAEHLRQPASRTHAFDVLDPLTGLNNEAFFNLRFDQELSRCRRNGGRFTVVTAHVERPPESGRQTPASPRDVQLVAELIALSSRPEDILAHFGDGEIMALLPDTDQMAAEQITLGWRRQLWPVTDGLPPPASPFLLRIGLCQYGHPVLGGDGHRALTVQN